MIEKVSFPESIQEITLKQFKAFEKLFRTKSKGVESFFVALNELKSDEHINTLWLDVKSDFDTFIYEDCPYMLKIVNIFSSRPIQDSEVTTNILERLFFEVVGIINSYKGKDIQTFEHAGHTYQLANADLSNVVIGEFLSVQSNLKDPIQNFNIIVSNIVKSDGKDLTLEQVRTLDTLPLNIVLDISFFLERLLILSLKRLKNSTKKRAIHQIINLQKDLQKSTHFTTQ